MNENNGYSAFCLWHGLKLHFTTKSYDWVKYHGKCSISKEQFLNKKEKYVFYKLSRNYSYEDLKSYFVSNLFENPKVWWGELNTNECVEVYNSFNKRKQALTYQFEQDIIHLFGKVERPNDIFTVKDGQEPLLLKEIYYGNIAPETMVIINSFTNIFDVWDKQIQDDIVYPAFVFRCKKYEPFVVFDKKKFKEILNNQIKLHK